MLSAIFNVLPDWAVAVILAALAWFGLNYVWLGPWYFEARARKDQCMTSFHSSDVRYDAAMYTSTIGIMGSESEILNKRCGYRK